MADSRRAAHPRDLFEPTLDHDETRRALRIVEALLFAAKEPLDEATLARKLPEGADVAALLEVLASEYAGRGFELRRVAGKWMFRTAHDLGDVLRDETVDRRKLTRAQLETLAIVAYHQPVTRAEIEEIRGVATSKGTLDVLLETNWVRMRGRRRTPGRPLTYGTTDAFLLHFSLDSIQDLPGLEELKGIGLIDARLPPGFAIPMPDGHAALRPDEDPLDEEDLGEEPETTEEDEDNDPLQAGGQR
jgi:segregation and condensation protein B